MKVKFNIILELQLSPTERRFEHCPTSGAWRLKYNNKRAGREGGRTSSGKTRRESRSQRAGSHWDGSSRGNAARPAERDSITGRVTHASTELSLAGKQSRQVRGTALDGRCDSGRNRRSTPTSDRHLCQSQTERPLFSCWPGRLPLCVTSKRAVPKPPFWDTRGSVNNTLARTRHQC